MRLSSSHHVHLPSLHSTRDKWGKSVSHIAPVAHEGPTPTSEQPAPETGAVGHAQVANRAKSPVLTTHVPPAHFEEAPEHVPDAQLPHSDA